MLWSVVVSEHLGRKGCAHVARVGHEAGGVALEPLLGVALEEGADLVPARPVVGVNVADLGFRHEFGVDEVLGEGDERERAEAVVGDVPAALVLGAKAERGLLVDDDLEVLDADAEVALLVVTGSFETTIPISSGCAFS